MRQFIAALAALLLPAVAVAQDGAALTSLQTGVEAAGWEAVGRLDIDGKGFCTATLIAPDLVLTAAHCLHERTTGEPIAPDRIEFLAGLRNGRALAYRDIRRAVTHPSYVHDGTARTETSRWDIALLELARPIRSTEVTPFEVVPFDQIGDRVGIVSYAHDRAEAPALQEVCDVIGLQDGLAIFGCDVDFGSSGAPVFRIEDGVAQVISVVSAKAEYDGARVAVGMDLDAPLAELRAQLADASFAAAPPGAVRVIGPGERTETGARFISVGD